MRLERAVAASSVAVAQGAAVWGAAGWGAAMGASRGQVVESAEAVMTAAAATAVVSPVVKWVASTGEAKVAAREVEALAMSMRAAAAGTRVEMAVEVRLGEEECLVRELLAVKEAAVRGAAMAVVVTAVVVTTDLVVEMVVMVVASRDLVVMVVAVMAEVLLPTMVAGAKGMAGVGAVVRAVLKAMVKLEVAEMVWATSATEPTEVELKEEVKMELATMADQLEVLTAMEMVVVEMITVTA